MILLAAIVLGGGGFLLHLLYLKPMTEKENAAAKLQKDIDEKNERIDQVMAERARLERWKAQSLPADKDLAMREYEKYLSDLFRKSGFTSAAGLTITPKSSANDKSAASTSTKGPTYITLEFLVTAHANLEDVIKMMEGFYRTSLLHRIKNVTLTRPLTTTGPQGQVTKANELDITMTIDALVLQGAENRQYLMPGVDKRLLAIEMATVLSGGPSGLALAPWAVGPLGPLGPGKLAAAPGMSPRDYLAMTEKNVFMGPPPPGQKGPLVDAKQFVHMTTISSKDGKEWEAFLYNRIDGGREIRLRASAGFNSFRIPDGDSTVQAKVIRIDAEKSEIIFQMGEKYYALHNGQTLEEALRKPLSDTQLKDVKEINGAIKAAKKDE
jgi:hypothetical protein